MSVEPVKMRYSCENKNFPSKTFRVSIVVLDGGRPDLNCSTLYALVTKPLKNISKHNVNSKWHLSKI